MIFIGSDHYSDDEGTSNRFDYLNATERLSGWTPLHLAAIGGHVDVVYLLMEAGCDARVQDKVGFHHYDTISKTESCSKQRKIRESKTASTIYTGYSS